MTPCRILVALFLLLTLASPAAAHWADSARADVRLAGREAHVELVVPSGLLKAVGKDPAALEAFIAERVKLFADGQAAEAKLVTSAPDTASPAGDPHTTLALTYTFPAAAPVPVRATLEYALFAPDAPAARCLAEISVQDAYENVVLTPASPRFEAGAPQAWWEAAKRFVVSGVAHIMGGPDHVLFLVSLLMIGGGVWYVVKVVTAFTIAHAITLSVAVLGYANPPGSWIEPLIALTIVYVAAENFFRKETSGRWIITFLFGLIHGFGFAGALAESGLPATHLAVSLVSFNLGIELGQLAIVLIASAGLYAIRNQAWERTLRLAISGGVVAIGLYWFVERTLLT